jgi:hypothetical protein
MLYISCPNGNIAMTMNNEEFTVVELCANELMNGRDSLYCLTIIIITHSFIHCATTAIAKNVLFTTL